MQTGNSYLNYTIFHDKSLVDKCVLDITNNWDLENKEIKNILIYSLHTMIIINIFYLIFVMLKNVKNTKYIIYNN